MGKARGDGENKQRRTESRGQGARVWETTLCECLAEAWSTGGLRIP